MEKPDSCPHCGKPITGSNRRRACSFYWLSDVKTTRVDELTFEWEAVYVPESVKGPDRCGGWGCETCMEEFRGRFFHKECPKIPKRKVEV